MTKPSRRSKRAVPPTNRVTRSQKRVLRERWPPALLSENNEVVSQPITLPEEIYWDFVRPFTPPSQLQCVSKRCSTRFPASNRMSIDDTVSHYARYKTKHGNYGYSYTQATPGEMKPGQIKVWKYPLVKTIPLVHVVDAKETQDPTIVRTKLLRSRELWDAHLLAMDSPTKRLLTSLELLVESERHALPGILPGNGDIQGVLDFHLDANHSALDGHVTDGVFPPTILGHYVGSWCDGKMEDLHDNVLYGATENYGRVVRLLLQAGADTNAFAEPVGRNWVKLDINRHHCYVPPWERENGDQSLIHWLEFASQGDSQSVEDEEERWALDQFYSHTRTLHELLVTGVQVAASLDADE